jgi:hypothetical protein
MDYSANSIAYGADRQSRPAAKRLLRLAPFYSLAAALGKSVTDLEIGRHRGMPSRDPRLLPGTGIIWRLLVIPRRPMSPSCAPRCSPQHRRCILTGHALCALFRSSAAKSIAGGGRVWDELAALIAARAGEIGKTSRIGKNRL